MLRPGDHLDAFVIEQPLTARPGRVAWRAQERITRRPVLVTMAAPDAGEVAAFRLEREATILSRLDHPGFPTYAGRGWYGDRPYVATVLSDAMPLGGLLADGGRLAELPALRIAHQVAAAMDHGWRTIGLVHRGLHPGSLSIALDAAGDPTVTITDLEPAMARLDVDVFHGDQPEVAAEVDQVTRTEGTGHPLTAAPEQFRGRAPGPAADMYALGAILHWMLAGSPPFDGGAAALVEAHLRRPPPDLPGLVPGVHPRTTALVQRLLAKQPEARWRDWASLVASLGAILDQRAPAAPSAPVRERTSRRLRRLRSRLRPGGEPRQDPRGTHLPDGLPGDAEAGALEVLSGDTEQPTARRRRQRAWDRIRSAVVAPPVAPAPASAPAPDTVGILAATPPRPVPAIRPRPAPLPVDREWVGAVLVAAIAGATAPHPSAAAPGEGFSTRLRQLLTRRRATTADADRAIDAGRLAVAARVLDDLAGQGTPEPVLHVRRARIEALQDNHALAIRHAQLALAGGSGDPRALAVLALEHLRLGRATLSATIAGRLADEHPDDVHGPLLLAAGALFDGRLAEADRALQAAGTRDADAPAYLALMAARSRVDGDRLGERALLEQIHRRRPGFAPVEDRLAEIARGERPGQRTDPG
jgi:hypothetical protein